MWKCSVCKMLYSHNWNNGVCDDTSHGYAPCRGLLTEISPPTVDAHADAEARRVADQITLMGGRNHDDWCRQPFLPDGPVGYPMHWYAHVVELVTPKGAVWAIHELRLLISELKTELDAANARANEASSQLERIGRKGMWASRAFRPAAGGTK